MQHPHRRQRGQFVAVAGLGGGRRVVEEGDLAAMPLGNQGAHHRHHGGDTAAPGDEQDAPRARVRQHEIAADAGQADHHAASGVVVQMVRDQPAVVPADGQLEGGRAFAVGRRIAAGVPAPVDLDGEVDVLAGCDGIAGQEGVVGLQGERDAARRGAAHVGHFGAGLAPRPRRCHQLGVTIDAVRTGQQVEQLRTQHPLPHGPREDPAGSLNGLSEHMYTVAPLRPSSQGFTARMW